MRRIVLSVGCEMHPETRLTGHGDSVRAAVAEIEEKARTRKWAGKVRENDSGYLFCPDCAQDMGAEDKDSGRPGA